VTGINTATNGKGIILFPWANAARTTKITFGSAIAGVGLRSGRYAQRLRGHQQVLAGFMPSGHDRQWICNGHLMQLL
jgi:hypothetical protein